MKKYILAMTSFIKFANKNIPNVSFKIKKLEVTFPKFERWHKIS